MGLLSKLRRREEQAEQVCPRCGLPAAADATECPDCGWDLREAYQRADPAPGGDDRS